MIHNSAKQMKVSVAHNSANMIESIILLVPSSLRQAHSIGKANISSEFQKTLRKGGLKARNLAHRILKRGLLNEEIRRAS